MNRNVPRFFIAAAACWAMLQLPALATRAAPDSQAGSNLLTNGGMEGKYVIQCSARNGQPWVAVPCGDPIDFATTFLWQTVQVPAGWVGWWRPPNTDNDDPNLYNSYPYTCGPTAPAGCAAWHNPEFRDTAGGPQEPSRKVAGGNSQKYFTFYSLHEAGLYQTVGGLQPGQRVRFSVYMHAWSNPENDPYHSAGQPTMGLRVGIDPFGGNNPWSGNIVWSPVKEAFDHWELFVVEAAAQADRVTVFTRSAPHFAVQHNDVYVDEASLVVVGQPTATSTPNASGTLKATATPEATGSSTPTRRPTRTPTPTSSPTPTATSTSTLTPTPTATPTSTRTPTATLPAVFVTAPAGSDPMLLAGGVIGAVLLVSFVLVKVSSSPAGEEA